MAFSVKLVQRMAKKKADGTAPIYLRIIADRKSRVTSTGVAVLPSQWNKDREEVRKSHPLSKALNARLADLKAGAVSGVASAKSPSDALAVTRGNTNSFTDFFEQHIEHLAQDENAFWERKKYASTLRKVRAALGHNVSFAQLDPEALERVLRFMRTECGNKVNTAHKDLSRVRRVVRLAIRAGRLASGQNPFDRFDMPRRSAVHRRKLTLIEIERLSEANLPLDSRSRVSRDAFVFAFYAGGMRFGDVASLKVRDVRRSTGELRVSYRMNKTDQHVSLPLPPSLSGMVDRYAAGKRGGDFLFGLLQTGDDRDPVYLRRRISSRNATANRDLKEVATIVGLVDPDALSFHVARHSFADYARVQSGDVYAISKALGHKRLAITERYLKSFDQDATDTMVRGLWV
jgi:integrase